MPKKKDNELFGEKTLKTVNISTNDEPGNFELRFEIKIKIKLYQEENKQ